MENRTDFTSNKLKGICKNTAKTKTITKKELGDAISDVFNVNKFDASQMVRDILLEISKDLADGNDVKIPNFGTFFTTNKKERVGRNPRTLKTAIITSRKSCSFRASAVLKKNIQNT